MFKIQPHRNRSSRFVAEACALASKSCSTARFLCFNFHRETRSIFSFLFLFFSFFLWVWYSPIIKFIKIFLTHCLILYYIQNPSCKHDEYSSHGGEIAGSGFSQRVPPSSQTLPLPFQFFTFHLIIYLLIIWYIVPHEKCCKSQLSYVSDNNWLSITFTWTY